MKFQQYPSTLDELDLELLEHYILQANGGNPESAKLLLSIFSNQVRRGELVADALLEFVTKAFEEILSGEKPANALRLTRARQRPVKNFHRDLHIALKVRKNMNEGMTLEKSAADLSEEYKLHESQIKEIYRKYKKIAIEQLINRIIF